MVTTNEMLDWYPWSCKVRMAVIVIVVQDVVIIVVAQIKDAMIALGSFDIL